jgi:hypothetical protein
MDFLRLANVGWLAGQVVAMSRAPQPPDEPVVADRQPKQLATPHAGALGLLERLTSPRCRAFREHVPGCRTRRETDIADFRKGDCPRFLQWGQSPGNK